MKIQHFLLLGAVGLVLGGPAVFAAEPTPAPKKPIREFLHQYLHGKSYKGEDLKGAKFTRVNLAKSNFEGANLDGATFRQVRLTHANFVGSIFGEETKFRECTLNEAELEGLDLKGADFHRINLRGANLKNSKGWGDISDCTFCDADLRGADFSRAKGDLDTVQWTDAVYDDKTVFPPGVKAEDVGATREVKPE